MDGKSAVELVEIGGQIVALGGDLEKARSERDALNDKVKALEGELRPLLTRHAQLMAELSGIKFDEPAPPPPVVLTPTPGGTYDPTREIGRKFIIERKLKTLLANVEPGENKGAEELALEMREDPTLVREVMRDMMTASRG